MNRVIFFLLILQLLLACDFLDVDKCLDNGGRWNDGNSECETE